MSNNLDYRNSYSNVTVDEAWTLVFQAHAAGDWGRFSYWQAKLRALAQR